MDILYRRGRATASEVMAELSGEPSYSTVRTQLRMLEAKGHVVPRRRGAALRLPARGAAARRAPLGAAPSRGHLLRRLGGKSRRRAARRRVVAAVRRGARSHRRSGRESAERRHAMTLFAGVFVKTTLVVALALAAMPLLRPRSAALRHWVLAMALTCAAAMPAADVRRAGLAAAAGGFARDAAGSPRSVVRRDPAPAGSRRCRCGRAGSDTSRPRRPARPRDVDSACARVGVRRRRQRGDPRRRLRPAPSRSPAAPSACAMRDGSTWRRSARASTGSGSRSRCCAAIIRRCSSRGACAVRRSSCRWLRASWSDERARIVLHHELAHVSRGDWLIQMSARLRAA